MIRGWRDQREYKKLREVIKDRFWRHEFGFDEHTIAISTVTRLMELAGRYDGKSFQCFRDGWLVGGGRLSPDDLAIELGFEMRHSNFLLDALTRSGYLEENPRIGLYIAKWDTVHADAAVHKYLALNTLTFAGTGKQPRLTEFPTKEAAIKKGEFNPNKKYREDLSKAFLDKYGRPLFDDPIQPTFQFWEGEALPGPFSGPSVAPQSEGSRSVQVGETVDLGGGITATRIED